MSPAVAEQLRLISSERRHAPWSSGQPELGDLHPRLLRCFVAVAEELHFSRAADLLFIPQPWLSRTIRQLEQQAGTPLFVRSTRSVRLTQTGRRLLPAAREVLEELDAVGRLARARHAELRVAHVPGHDTAMLVLDRLARDAPEYAVEELTLRDSEQPEAVEDGRIDVAVCRAPGRPRPDLCRQMLRLDPALAAVRRGSDDPPDSVDLRRNRVALAAELGPESIESRLALELERRLGRALPRVQVAPGSGTELGAFERAGEPIFLTFESAVISHWRYARVGVAPMQPLVPWWLLWRRDNASPAAHAFLDAARVVARERLWETTAGSSGEPVILGGVP